MELVDYPGKKTLIIEKSQKRFSTNGQTIKGGGVKAGPFRKK